MELNIQVTNDANPNKKFVRLNPGTHFAVIESAEVKYVAYMASNAVFASDGQALEVKYKTFGNADPDQNGKTVYQSTPINGTFARQTIDVFNAANPGRTGNKYETEDLKGKAVEIDLVYNIDKKTGEERKFANVKKVRAYVGSGTVPTIKDAGGAYESGPSFDSSAPF